MILRITAEFYKKELISYFKYSLVMTNVGALGVKSYFNKQTEMRKESNKVKQFS